MAPTKVVGVKVVRKTNVRKEVMRALMREAELKGFNDLRTGLVATSTGVVYSLSNAIINGTEFNQRSGAEITVKSLNFSVDVRISALILSATTRFLIFQDIESNGAVPAAADVLYSANYLSDYNVLNVTHRLGKDRRFRILHDQTIIVTNSGANAEVNKLNKHISGYDPKISYLGDANANASNGRNTFYMLVIGTNTGATFAGFDFSFGWRYHDM